jgi:hypothetical protein
LKHPLPEAYLMGSNDCWLSGLFRMLITSSVPLLSQRLQRPIAEQRSLSWLEDFLYAGVSALLLVFLRLHTQVSLICLAALAPYFWRLVKADLRGALRLGVMLANSFVFVAYADNLILAPGIFCLQLACFNVIFASYGFAVWRVREYFGHGQFLLIFLWLPLEFAFNHLGGRVGFRAFDSVDPWLSLRFVTLLQGLIFTLLIILLNPLLLLVAGHIVKRVLGRTRLLIERTKGQTPHISPVASVRQWFYFPDLRSPPLVQRLFNL